MSAPSSKLMDVQYAVVRNKSITSSFFTLVIDWCWERCAHSDSNFAVNCSHRS